MQKLISILAASGAMLAVSTAFAQQDFSAVRIETIPVAKGIYMLSGSGGNIGLSVGPDGAFLVDDQYAPLSEKIVDAIRAVEKGPIRFVVNTHWHGDHPGGNENMAVKGAIIVAHENVRTRLTTEQSLPLFNHHAPPAPAGALPLVTFSNDVTFHFNGNTIRAFHVKNAHTDSDALIHFVEANVIHMGDIFWNGRYPRIDAGHGGNVKGLIAAVEAALEAGDSRTRYIPGHGPLPEAGPAALNEYLEMLRATMSAVQELVHKGLSEDAVVAARPTRHYDAAWGKDYMKPDVFTRVLYRSLRP